ncbi:MAG: flavin reductase family protein [Ilumatobacteraceae bacterium]
MSHNAVQSITDSLDPPLTIVTTHCDGKNAGCLVGFFAQCSIEPLLFAVWLSKANYTYRIGLFASHYAMHFPTVRDVQMADLFGGTTGDEVDKFAQCEWTPGPFDVPLLTRCQNRIVLERVGMFDVDGDHVCFVGAPIDAEASKRFEPFRISQVDVEPGHPAEERPAPDHPSRGPDLPDDAPRLDPQEAKLREDLAAGAGHPVDLPDDQDG